MCDSEPKRNILSEINNKDNVASGKEGLAGTPLSKKGHSLCFYDLSNPAYGGGGNENDSSKDEAFAENGSIPVLRLERFTTAPFVNFENVKVGKAKVTCLMVFNPSGEEQELSIEKFPFEKGFGISSIDPSTITEDGSETKEIEKSFLIPSLKEIKLYLSWFPAGDGNIREVAVFKLAKKYRLQVVILGTGYLPKAARNNAKKIARPGTSTRAFESKTKAPPSAGKEEFPVNETGKKKESKPNPDLETAAPKKSKSLAGINTHYSQVGVGGKRVSVPKKVVRKLNLKKVQTLSTANRNPVLLPYAAKNMYYDERWVDKQERGFTKWLNHMLTCDSVLSKSADDGSASIKQYSEKRKLNAIRKGACELYHSSSVVKVIHAIENELSREKLSVRATENIFADLGNKQFVISLLCDTYNDVWLRVGLETVYGEIICASCNDGAVDCTYDTMKSFLEQRLLFDPQSAFEYGVSSANSLYSQSAGTNVYKNVKPGFEKAMKAFILKKMLLLVYFLDVAKEKELLRQCNSIGSTDKQNSRVTLFKKDSAYKSSRDILVSFAQRFLAGEGDVMKHLGHIGYKVTHKQTYLDEFDYSVTNIAVDLRDGVRLVKLVELLIDNANANHGVSTMPVAHLSEQVRVPAISRLQKIHNNEVAVNTLVEKFGLSVADSVRGGQICVKDIVDGHREKTLALLWKIILHFEICVSIDCDQVRKEIRRVNADSCYGLKFYIHTPQKQSLGSRASVSPGLSASLYFNSDHIKVLLNWCQAVCRHFDVQVNNFTSSFSDGRVLCYLIHYYHPYVLPLACINDATTQNSTAEEEPEESEEEDNDGEEKKWSGKVWDKNIQKAHKNWSKTYSPSIGIEGGKPRVKLLANEKSNFKLIYESVQSIGGVPPLIKFSDMSGTLPDEKVVITYVAYLCNRLLEVSSEVRAAMCIQRCWRALYLKRRTQESLTVEVKARNSAAKCIQDCFRAYQSRSRKERIAKQKLMRHSATKIQSSYRSFVCRKAFQNKKTSVIYLQSLARVILAKKTASTMKQALVTLQKYSRGFLARKEYSRSRKAVLVCQSACRMLLCKRDFLRKKEGAIRLQANFRRHLAMNSFGCQRSACNKIAAVFRGHLQRKSFKAIIKAVVRLQAAIRAKICQKRYKLIVAATTTLQAVVKGYIVRKHLEKQGRSCTVLSSHFRGYRQRLDYAKTRKATICLQSFCRSVLCQKKYTSTLCAVAKIQALVRGYQSRCLMAKRAKAATVIASFYRRYQQQQNYWRTRKAIISIQAMVRMALSRSRYLQKIRSIVSIQALYRGQKAYVEFVKMKKSSTQIAKTFRGTLARRTFEKTKRACISIQAFMRMCKQRSKFCSSKRAAIVIQKHARARHARIMLKCLRACVKIQSFVRMSFARDRYRKFLWAVNRLQSNYRRRLCQTLFAKETAMIVRCQSFVRMALAKRAYERNVSKIIKLQALCRRIIVARKLRTQTCAAVVIQSCFRCFIARQSYSQQRLAAIHIQAAWRCVHSQKAFQQKKTAAFIIKSYMKMRMTRKTYLLNLQESKARHSASTKIQSFIKAFLACRKFLLAKKSCTKIQSYWKCHMQRSRYTAIRYGIIQLQAVTRMRLAQRDYRVIYRSVIKLQSSLRMARAVKDFRMKKRAIISIQAMWKGHLSRNDFGRTKRSILKIQALCRMRAAQARFQRVRSSVIAIQSFIRKLQTGKKYAATRRSIIIIQSFYRMCRTRRQFLRTKMCAIAIQSRFRGQRVRNGIASWKNCATVIQKHFRSFYARQRYLKNRNACIQIQAWYRSVLACKQLSTLKLERDSAIVVQKNVRMLNCKSRYRRLLKCAAQIQRICRAHLAYKQAQKEVNVWKNQITLMQATIRGFLARKNFHNGCRAVIVLQKTVRMLIARSNYHRMRKASCTIQKVFRRRQAMKSAMCHIAARKKSICLLQGFGRRIICQNAFKKQKAACVLLQKCIRGAQARKQFVKSRFAVIRMQAWCRGYLVRKGIEKYSVAACLIQSNLRTFLASKKFQQQRRAATVIAAARKGQIARMQLQTVRAGVTLLQSFARMRISRSRFVQTIHAAVRIQSCIRRYLSNCELHAQTRAAVIIQKHMRAYKARAHLQHLRERCDAAVLLQRHARSFLRRKYLQRFVRASNTHLQTIRIQRWFRRAKAIERALARMQSLITIQRWVRAKRVKFMYRNLRTKTIMYQKLFKERFTRRSSASVVLQKYTRGFLAKRKLQQIKMSTLTIQSKWRAYCARKKLRAKRPKLYGKLAKVRKALEKVNKTAQEHMKLGNRSKYALELLLNSGQLSTVLKACETLDVVTALSHSCCERVIEFNAVPIIFQLIHSCNRSKPHMEVLKHALSILKHLSMCPSTIKTVFDEPDSVNTIVELLQIYRDKDYIFGRACDLLIHLSRPKEQAVAIAQMPSILQRIKSIHSIVQRKYKIENKLNKIDTIMNISHKHGMAANENHSNSLKKLDHLLKLLYSAKET